MSVRPDGSHVSIRITDDGHGMPELPARSGSFGRRLIENLARQLSASIAWHPASPGTRVELRLPQASQGVEARS